MVGLIIAAPNKPVTCKYVGYEYRGYSDCNHKADTSDRCAESCRKHGLCYYWSWHMDSHVCCWMQKEKYEGKTQNLKMVSGNWACKDMKEN